MGHPDYYDKEQMDRDFRHFPGVSSPPRELRPIARIAELEVVLKAIFHFDEGFEWRLSGPNVRVYDRPGDGYIGVCL